MFAVGQLLARTCVWRFNGFPHLQFVSATTVTELKVCGVRAGLDKTWLFFRTVTGRS